MKVDVSLTYEIEVEGTVDYTPYRPMPACSNPDSPLFDDAGDDECWWDGDLYIVVKDKNGKEIARCELPRIFDRDSKFDNEVLYAARDAYESKIAKYEEYDGDE